MIEDSTIKVEEFVNVNKLTGGYIDAKNSNINETQGNGYNTTCNGGANGFDNTFMCTLEKIMLDIYILIVMIQYLAMVQGLMEIL